MTAAETFRPARAPIFTISRASRSASPAVRMKAPSPYFTSSRMTSAKDASFLLITEEAMSGMLSIVAVTSRTAYMRLSAGTVCSVCPATAPPMRPICAANSSAVRAVRKPAKLSSLSSVPPVCPSPLPEYFAQRTPRLHSTGTRMSVVESDTPPVECLSAMTPETGGRTGRSPLAAIASVRR